MTNPHWVRDPELGDRFVRTTMRFAPDYDGEVIATLVRNEPLIPHARGALLYLHGFIDYFFQSHVADASNGAGYNVYALDLRKYGRSLGGAIHSNFCRDFEEYFQEMTSAIDIITTVEHHDSVILTHIPPARSPAVSTRESATGAIAWIASSSTAPFSSCHIAGGKHDLVLSCEDARAQSLRVMLDWIG